MNRDLSVSSGTLCSVKNVNLYIFFEQHIRAGFKLNNAERNLILPLDLKVSRVWRNTFRGASVTDLQKKRIGTK
jgi:hypothetical protein